MEWRLNTRKKDERLDHALRAIAKEHLGWNYLSRAAWDDLFEQGRVLSLAGKKLKSGMSVAEAGEGVRIQVPALPLGLMPEQAPLAVLLKTKDLLLVDKPVGIDSYPLRPWERGTLANFVSGLLEQNKILTADAFQSLAEAPSLEAGLLQRLDFDTSGIVSIALNSQVKALIRKEFSRKKFLKKYYALVEKKPTWVDKELRGFLCPSGPQNMKWESKGPAEAEAMLTCKILAHAEGAALVEVTSLFGMRHIVRAGLAFLGHPLVGDKQYGASLDFSTHQLHASRLQYLGAQDFSGADELRLGINSAPPESFWHVARSLDVPRV